MTVVEAEARLAALEKEMQAYEFGLDCNQQKLNSSFILLAMKSLRSYLRGEIEDATDGFDTLATELRERQQMS